jgi:hypothetical protein
MECVLFEGMHINFSILYKKSIFDEYKSASLKIFISYKI